MRFLLVDDSATSRMALAAALRNATQGRAEVREAADAKAAEAAFAEAKPDVVFLDMVLDETQGGGGLDLLLSLLAAHPGARVILVTSLPHQHPDIVKALAQGAFAHLTKPIRTDAVRTVLQELDVEAGRVGHIK